MLYYCINLLIEFNIIKHLIISSRVILTLSLIIQCLFYVARVFAFSKIVKKKLRFFIFVIRMLNTTSRDV